MGELDFFCDLNCDHCGMDIERGEWHIHDYGEKTYHEDCWDEIKEDREGFGDSE